MYVLVRVELTEYPCHDQTQQFDGGELLIGLKQFNSNSNFQTVKATYIESRPSYFKLGIPVTPNNYVVSSFVVF